MSAGTNIRGAERLARLAAARQWRIDNKPYFYALYGAEPKPTMRCPMCSGDGRVSA